MTDFLRIILPIYFIIYFGVVFVLKSVMVAKQTGKNPFVLPKDDSAFGLVRIGSRTSARAPLAPLQEHLSHLCKSTSCTSTRAPLAPLQEHHLYLCKIPSCPKKVIKVIRYYNKTKIPPKSF